MIKRAVVNLRLSFLMALAIVKLSLKTIWISIFLLCIEVLNTFSEILAYERLEHLAYLFEPLFFGIILNKYYSKQSDLKHLKKFEGNF